MEDGPSTRCLQQVSSISDRKAVVEWMVLDSTFRGDGGLVGRTIRAFPEHFRGSDKANRMKASRWWKAQDNILRAGANPIWSSRGMVGKWSKTQLKAGPGRGRKTALWVEWLYERMLVEFERLRKAGVKLSPSLLRDMAVHMLRTSQEEYNAFSIDPADGISLVEKIVPSWIQSFMMKNNLVYREQTGRLICSPEKERHIEMITAHHLGVLQRGFSSGQFDENYVENIDEMHFVFNMDNGRTLGHRGDATVKYADVVAGGEAMTMVVRISGGVRSSIKCPMVIFSNHFSSYPIRDVPDNVPGVCYRSGPKGWMDRGLFLEYFREPRAYQGDPFGRLKHVWCDNCTSHTLTPTLDVVLRSKNTQLCYLPPCTTHLTQPADQFIIAKIKEAWIRRFEQKKTELISAGEWQNEREPGRPWSGKLKNPGKSFFLSLAANAVEDVNLEADARGISLARKSMIKCGLSLDLNGTWRIEQLFANLQRIIADHRHHFDGEPVPIISLQ